MGTLGFIYHHNGFPSFYRSSESFYYWLTQFNMRLAEQQNVYISDILDYVAISQQG